MPSECRGFAGASSIRIQSAPARERGGVAHRHLPAGQSGTLDLVPTEPSFGEVSVARGGGGAALFRDCAMTVAPDGAVYVVTQKELWKAAP